jgi:uracil-DNA glycosylase family 4
MGFEFDPSRKIAATGPSPCDIALFGEAGGETEYDQRRCFAGKAGIVLNTYLSSAGLKRHRVYVDNVYPYWTGPKNPDPTDDQVRGNLENLKRTLLKVRPRVIGCLGRISAKWILYNGEMEVDLDSHHGIAFERDWPWGKVLIVPCYHPAAGFYEPLNSGRCQYDIHQVAKAAKGEVAPHHVREIPTSRMHEFPHYRSGDVQIREGDGVDTEGTSRRPSLISWATTAESGNTFSVVARVNTNVTLSPTLPSRVTFHFALHDLPVIRAMRGDTSNLEVDDTMVMAFELGGIEPQGLKPLAFRHLGIQMTEYAEVVKPYFDRAVRSYIMKLLDTKLPAKGKTVWVERKNPKTGEIEDKLYTPKPPRERFWSVAAAATKGGDPVKVWKDLPDSYRELAEKNLPGERFPVFSQALELVPEEKVVKYAGADAWATKKLAPILLKKLDEYGVREAYEVDRKSLRYVDLMQSEGLPVNVERTRELSKTLEERLEATRKKMVKGIGRRFNPGSTDDVAEILYHDFRLTVPKLTDGGDPSTDKKAIQILRGRAKFEIEYEEDRKRAIDFLDSLISYRETQKNKSTYVDVILRTAKETQEGGGQTGWRIFPVLKNTRVASGRLSSGSIGSEDSLNVLAMPTRTEEGKKIRDLFEAPDGWEYLSADLSQIELRVMAGFSRDKRMLRAFQRGEDLHILTTSMIFGIEKEKIDKHSPQRFVGKLLNFAIMYFISARALLEQLNANGIYDYSLKDCEKFIAEWFKMYSGVRAFLEWCWEEAEKTGVVRDWMGRLRWVPNIRLPGGPMKEAAKREVGNHPIQSGAHEQVKLAEIELLPWMQKNREIVRPVLQIHDELLCLAKKGHQKKVAARVVAAMVKGAEKRFGVPVKADSSWGRTWAQAK